MQFNVGERIGDYEVAQVLGAGGMGAVYKVRNVISDRAEAMKVLLPDLQGDADLADRFLREIKVQASLAHPNIAHLHTALRHGNQLLMLMEYVEGVSVEKMIEGGRMPLEQALDYTMQVLQALGYAHARGVVHRDIKPANIMVTPDGIVKLMDFGIAKMRADKRLTQTGRTVGSLFYMSPEQIRGDKELDPRADLYSLGVTLYEITTGKRPFEGTSDFSIMAAHLQQAPVPPVELDPTLPAPLNEIILMAIAKDPAGRFQSADAFRNALGNVRGGIKGAVTQRPAAMVAPPPPAAAQPSPPRSNRGLYMAAGSLVTVAVLVLAALQFPKWYGTKAAESTQLPLPVQQQSQPAEKQPEVTVPAEPKPTSVETATRPEPSRPVVVPPMDARPKPQNTPPQTAQQRTPNNAAAPVQQTPLVQQAQQAPPPAATPQQQPSQQQQQQQQAPIPVQQTPPANPADLEAVRERMMKLAARVGAVQAKAKRIESEQRSQGLGMRSDVVSGIGRMTYFMDETENALRSGNTAGAKAALQKADRETDTLERILGII
ncbi:MAG TPA: protein kinase [Bryobacteraceae bacterium]|nr:protein kinase [Bryobacteraceae bacterium]